MGRRVIHQSEEQLKTTLDKKMKAGIAKIQKMKKEWDAVDCIYQAVAGDRLKSLAVDSGVVSSVAGLLPNATANVTLSARVGCALINHKSKLEMSEPTVIARALDQDFITKQAEEYTQQYCDNLYLSSPIKRILCSKVFLDVVIKGTGALAVNWNEYGGEVAEAPEDPDGEIKMTGDHSFRHVKMERFIIDPNAGVFEVDAKWCIEGMEYSIEELVWMYPEHKEFIIEMAEEHRKGRDCETDETAEETERPASLILWEYYEKHSIENGMRGAHVHFFRRGEGAIEIIQRGPLRNAHGLLPFCVFTDLDLINDSYGLSRGVLATSHHDRLCKFFTDIEKNIELFGHTRFLTPSTQQANILKVNGAIAIPFNAALGEKPIYLQPSAVSTDIWKFHGIISEEIDMIFSSGEFDRGEINRELSSYAVLTAIERSEAKLIGLFNKKKEFIKRMYMLILSDAQQFITEERAFNITGYASHHKYQSFKGTNLKGRVDQTVDFGQYMPVDPSARKQQMFELLKMGALEKAGIPMKDIVSKMIGGDVKDVKTMLDMAEAVQEAEINRMIEGKEAPVQPYHEHLSHIHVLAEFMNDAPFEALDAPVKQAIFDHFNRHNTEAAKIMAMAKGGGLPGGVSATSGGTPPLQGVPPPPPAK